MTGFQSIIFAFTELGKTAHALVLAQGMELLLPAGDQLMGIALMTNIPDQFVCRGIEDRVQGQGQLNHAQTWRQMAAGLLALLSENLFESNVKIFLSHLA